MYNKTKSIKMNKRKPVLDNERRLIEKLKNMSFDDLKLEIDEFIVPVASKK